MERLMTGAGLIAAERQRQITDEGYSQDHDQAHGDGQLLDAAVCYIEFPRDGMSTRVFQQQWPWQLSYWKPSPDDRVRELVKAGALIAAEIDRLMTQ